jgi:CheY-like chemotaxis protein
MRAPEYQIKILDLPELQKTGQNSYLKNNPNFIFAYRAISSRTLLSSYRDISAHVKLRWIMNEKKKILIIDDDRNFAFGLITIFRKAGYEVVSASNGKDGLAAIQAEKPDLILSDLMMPPPNGIQLKKELAAFPELNRIPFIFLTARTGQLDKDTGLECGAEAYITKPLEMTELLERVKNIFDRGISTSINSTFVSGGCAG